MGVAPNSNMVVEASSQPCLARAGDGAGRPSMGQQLPDLLAHLAHRGTFGDLAHRGHGLDHGARHQECARHARPHEPLQAPLLRPALGGWLFEN